MTSFDVLVSFHAFVFAKPFCSQHTKFLPCRIVDEKYHETLNWKQLDEY